MIENSFNAFPEEALQLREQEYTHAHTHTHTNTFLCLINVTINSETKWSNGGEHGLTYKRDSMEYNYIL